MDTLKQVKAEVKAWERAFKAENKREPTKNDIKTAPGIAAKYSLYRKLVKESTTGSASRTSQPPTAPPITSPAFTTPRKPKPAQVFVTPKNERTAPPVNPFASPSRHAGPSRSDSSTIAGTGYRKPIHDPSPINPFSNPSDSPFVYAQSPKKLKSLLEANSLQRQTQTQQVTPRTRARKRLRGEEVEDTPGKTKTARLGRRPASSSMSSNADGAVRPPPAASSRGLPARRGPVFMSDTDSDALDEDDGEAIGPTPIKTKAGRHFSSIFAEVVEQDDDGDVRMEGNVGGRKPSPPRRMTLFSKCKQRDDMLPSKRVESAQSDARSSTSASSITQPQPQTSTISSPQVEPQDEVMADAEAEEATPSDLPLNGSADESDPSITVDEGLAREIELSGDEFDGAANPLGKKPTVRIEPYRLGVQKRLARQRTRQTLSASPDPPEQRDDNEAADYSHGFSSLAILSPTSKVLKKTMALQETRARAIFDTKAANRLKAAKRAPIWLPGEGEDEEHSSDALGGEADTTADDDWESDPEGWKATGLPDDDDW